VEDQPILVLLNQLWHFSVFCDTTWSDHLVLLYDLPAFDLMDLHKYFQNFTDFIESNKLMTLFFLQADHKKHQSSAY